MSDQIISIKIEGLKELDAKLREFGPKVAENGLRAATRAAAVVFANALKGAAPVKTGLLKANLVASKRRASGANHARYAARVKPGPIKKYVSNRSNKRMNRVGQKYQTEGPAFYARFVEYGTSKWRGHPFMRQAFGASYDSALDAFKKRLRKAVDDAAKK